MKNLLKFILFLTYSIGIFFVKNYIVFGLISIINIILIIKLKIKIKKVLNSLFKMSFVILFTSGINIIAVDLNFGIVVAIRLLLICNMTYIFSNAMTYMEFAEVIEKVVMPLKIFKINPRDISLTICMAITFIPIFNREISQIKNALTAKGIRTNRVKDNILILKPLLVSTFRKVNEISDSLRAKGYQE